MTMPGPKIPPEPPEPMESPVARIRANGTMQDDPQGMDSSRWPRLCWIQP